MAIKILLLLSTFSFFIGGGIYAAFYFYYMKKYTLKIQERNDELKTKKQEMIYRLQNIPRVDKHVHSLTDLRICDLMAGIDAKSYTALDVVRAYQLKALLKDKEYNFIADINENAESDIIESQTSKRSALRGLPVSLKETFTTSGCQSTFGLPSNLFDNAIFHEDCVLVKALRLQGAIPMLVTNTSQADITSLDCSNPVYDETLNPFDKKRCTGGSCGGEAVALSVGASLIGVGDDKGGELRISAHFCGILAIKPTSHRISRRLIQWNFPYQNFIISSPGLMARKIEDLVVFFKAITCSDLYHLDPLNPPLCFNDKIYEKKRALRIGYFINIDAAEQLCGRVPPIPAITRATIEAKQTLFNLGHNIIDFKIPNFDYAIYQLFLPATYMDGGKAVINDMLAFNPTHSSISYKVLLLRLPNFCKIILGNFIKPFNPTLGHLLISMAGLSSSYSVWKLHKNIQEYRELVIKQWQDYRLDVVICPVYPIIAPIRNNSIDFSIEMISYVAIFNLLDFPAGVVPVTKVSKQDIRDLRDVYPQITDIHKYIHKTQTDGTMGMPVGVQFVSLPWREETSLRAMKDVSLSLAEQQKQSDIRKTQRLTHFQ